MTPPNRPRPSSHPVHLGADRRGAAAKVVAPVALGVALLLPLAACSRGNDASSPTTAPEATTTTTRPLDPAAGEREIAYLSTDARGGSKVFLAKGTGADLRVVAEIDGRVEQLTWSPDGSKLLLDGDGTGDFELLVVDVASGEVTPLAPSASSNEGGARWSPDGTRVAFFSNREGWFAGYVVEIETGEITRISPEEAEGVANLAWRPDGEEIAFSTSFQLESDVWLVAPDGSDARIVSSLPGSTQPSWSPDGDRIATTAWPLGNETSGIFVIDLASGETEELVDTEYADGFPVWSPDGAWVYFVAETPNDDADGGAADDLLRVSADGGEPEAVIADPISVELEVDVAAGADLIAFSVIRLGDKEVFVANADGTGAIPLSRSEAFDGFGVWRPVMDDDA